jgi:hypothetical protein
LKRAKALAPVGQLQKSPKTDSKRFHQCAPPFSAAGAAAGACAKIEHHGEHDLAICRLQRVRRRRFHDSQQELVLNKRLLPDDTDRVGLIELVYLVSLDLRVELRDELIGHDRWGRVTLHLNHKPNIPEQITSTVPNLTGKLENPGTVCGLPEFKNEHATREFFRQTKQPLFLWLRLITGQRLMRVHRQHFGAAMRDSVSRYSSISACRR